MSQRSKPKKWPVDDVPPTGSKIFGFSLGHIIGKGTYSKVCLATNIHSQKKFACKIISKRTSGEDYVKKFLPRELQIISRINHPHIVTVYKVVEMRSTVYVFMDYCKYGDLLEYIKANGPYSEDKAKMLFKQIVEAVHYLHTLDIAHRDIKCENIFLISSNIVKLGDFGFSRYCVNDVGESELSNTFCGSAAYAAPEILQGKCYDPKKYDIWALGCILYVMLTASMPFNDFDIRRMVKDQMERNIQNFDLFWDYCTPNMKRLQILLLEPESQYRISTFQIINHPWFKADPLLNKRLYRSLYSTSDSLLV